MTFTETYGAVRDCMYEACPYYVGAAKRDTDGCVLAVLCNAPYLKDILKDRKVRETTRCALLSRKKKTVEACEDRIQRLRDAIENSQDCGLLMSGYRKEIEALEKHLKIVENL